MPTSNLVLPVLATLLLACGNQANSAPPSCPQGAVGPRCGSADVTSGPAMHGRHGGRGAMNGGMMQPGGGGGGMMMGPDSGGGMHGGGMPGGGPMMGRAQSTPAATLSVDAKAALDGAIQGEYAAEQLYRQIADQFKRPFRTITFAEQRHVWALENLYVARGLEAPKSDTTTKPTTFKDLKAACAAGVAAEKANIARYDEALKKDLPLDVRRTLTHLKMASERHHLPIFERCD